MSRAATSRTSDLSGQVRIQLLVTGVVVAFSLIAGVSTSSAAATCFGAAERDPQHPCSNPSLSITPAFKDVDDPPHSRCREVDQDREPQFCTFGRSAAKAKRRIALIGDSHALQWRGALEGVARAKRWRGYSLTAPACVFSAVTPQLGEPFLSDCRRWNRAVRRWLREHPRVSTIFVSQYSGLFVVAPAGTSMFDAAAAGYQRRWRALPKTVKRIVVLRDIPSSSDATFGCVRDVLAAGTERPGPACPRPRSAALLADPAVSAAAALHHRRYRFVDLTEFFCGPVDCYTVIGGVLVYRDITHMTVTFSKSLGPYLLRKVRRVLG